MAESTEGSYHAVNVLKREVLLQNMIADDRQIECNREETKLAGQFVREAIFLNEKGVL